MPELTFVYDVLSVPLFDTTPAKGHLALTRMDQEQKLFLMQMTHDRGLRSYP
jgi:hypothetical protein